MATLGGAPVSFGEMTPAAPLALLSRSYGARDHRPARGWDSDYDIRHCDSASTLRLRPRGGASKSGRPSVPLANQSATDPLQWGFAVWPAVYATEVTWDRIVSGVFQAGIPKIRK
jgi:hypothetical protein